MCDDAYVGWLILFPLLFFKVSALPIEAAERKTELEGTSAAPGPVFTCR